MRRRDLLRTGSGLVATALLLLAWRAGPGMQGAGQQQYGRRYGRHYLVNGWILSRPDLEALRRHDA